MNTNMHTNCEIVFIAYIILKRLNEKSANENGAMATIFARIFRKLLQRSDVRTL